MFVPDTGPAITTVSCLVCGVRSANKPFRCRNVVDYRCELTISSEVQKCLSGSLKKNSIPSQKSERHQLPYSSVEGEKCTH